MRGQTGGGDSNEEVGTDGARPCGPQGGFWHLL